MLLTTISPRKQKGEKMEWFSENIPIQEWEPDSSETLICFFLNTFPKIEMQFGMQSKIFLTGKNQFGFIIKIHWNDSAIFIAESHGKNIVLSVDSEVEITTDWYNLIRTNLKKKEVEKFLPSDCSYEGYEVNKKKFSGNVRGEYHLFTFLWILFSTLYDEFQL